MPGPDPKNLRFMAGMLPSMVDHHEAKRKAKGGVSVHKAQPTKNCNICSKMFDYKVVLDGEIAMGTCPECQKQLDEGQTAFVCRSMSQQFYAFATNPDLADMAGKIMEISEPIFRKAFAKWFEEQNAKDEQQEIADEMARIVILPQQNGQPPAA
jgi:hypothetical protein